MDDDERAEIREDDAHHEADADSEYEFYAEWFSQMPLQKLLEVVARTHEDIWLGVLHELQYAVVLLYESFDANARLAGYLRAYRAIDSYDRKLKNSVVEAFAEPFLGLFEKPIKPWKFFQPQVLEGIRRRAFDGAFHGPEVREAMESFYRNHSGDRNHIAHGWKIPTHNEFRAMLLDAKAVYDLADKILHRPIGGVTHIPILGPEHYPHDDFVPGGYVINRQVMRK